MYSFDDIIGESSAIKRVVALGKKVCNSKSPIFIYGATGTGKELIVQAIHSSSIRGKEPFIAQNCAAIPEKLMESTFFGAARGGYTGAVESKGLLELAGKGTLYLDELNSMSMEFQGKLLRVLQEGEYRRIGENSLRKSEARIIASVNETADFLLKSNKLRKDLYYRLNVVRIEMPDLSERKEDIPILVECFIEKLNKSMGVHISGVDHEAMRILMERDYDGNIRELQHIIEGVANIKGEGILQACDFYTYGLKNKDMSLRNRLESAEKQYIIEALAICGDNVSEAARLLKIPRQTLQYKMKRYDIKKIYR